MIEKLRREYQKIPIQVKASVWFLVCAFLQKGISVISTPIFTRLLSTAEYGQYSVFNSWLGIVTIFVTLNLSAGVYTQGLIKFSDERDIFSSSLQGLVLTMVAIWTGVYLIGKSFWNDLLGLTTVQMLAILVMIWATAVFSFWTVEQRVKLNYKILVIVTLIISVLKPAVGVIFVINAEDKVTARILGLALVELVGYVAFFIIQMKRGKKFYSKKYWKYALAFNIPLLPHYLSQTVLSGADRIIIEKMIGASEAGIYSLAYSISQIMLLFNTALGQTISPWIYQKIKDRKEKDIAKVAYGGLLIIAAVNIILIALAPEIVSFFAPKSYYDAIYVVPPIAMSGYFMFAYDLFAKFEFYFEKTKWIAGATAISSGLNIVLNYIFIKIFGYEAAGYTTLVCYILYALFHYLMMQKVCKEHMDNAKVYDIKILVLMTIIFVGLGFSFLFLYKYMVIRYVFVCVIIAIAFIFRKKLIKFSQELLKKK